jgi:hypothetical protein
MATSSFLKNVNIKGKKQCQNFVLALEASADSPRKKVVFSKPVSRLNTEQITQNFGKK